MATIEVKVGAPPVIVMTGIEFLTYAQKYLRGAEALITTRDKDLWFDPLPYQLLCQSLELQLKSFIWLKDKLPRGAFKGRYGHDLVKLWRHSISKGLAAYCSPTPLRTKTIALVGPYYAQRKFAYLDLSMSWKGIPALRAEPQALEVLQRLCRRLSKSLEKPILAAS